MVQCRTVLGFLFHFVPLISLLWNWHPHVWNIILVEYNVICAPSFFCHNALIVTNLIFRSFQKCNRYFYFNFSDSRIHLGTFDIFIILSLSIHEHRTSLHWKILIRSSANFCHFLHTDPLHFTSGLFSITALGKWDLFSLILSCCCWNRGTLSISVSTYFDWPYWILITSGSFSSLNSLGFSR